MKKIFAYTFYPLTLLACMFATWEMIAHGETPIMALTIVVIIANALIWLAEFALPYQKSWRPSGRVLLLDIAHTMVSAKVITPFAKLLLLELIAKYSLQRYAIWPYDLPIWVQVIIAIIIGDLLIYTLHRWMHLSDFGWKIHVVHHTPTKLHFWASARSHPINVMLVYTTEVGVLLLLGISPEALAIWTIFMSVNGLFQHCNCDIKPGILNSFLATCDVHRVHHSPDWKYSNSNFGNTTVLWDRLFGTYCLPEKPITEVGIKKPSNP
jgi:sterol desaturase/sphingolipid hydroxylase (fatty acid hydroxylase superfamily)